MANRGILSKSGFTLVEIMVAMGVMSIAMLAMLTLNKISQKQQSQSNLAFQADLFRRNLQVEINNSGAWAKTIAATTNSRTNGPALDCIVAGTPCTVDGTDKAAGGVPLANVAINQILDNSGAVVYDSTQATRGISAQGVPCNTFATPPAAGNDGCPMRFNITWTAVCGSSCVNPQPKIQVMPVFNPSPSNRIALNPYNYSASFFQGSAGTTPPSSTFTGPTLYKKSAVVFDASNTDYTTFRWYCAGDTIDQGASWQANCAPPACPAGFTDLGTNTEVMGASYTTVYPTNGSYLGTYFETVNLSRTCAQNTTYKEIVYVKKGGMYKYLSNGGHWHCAADSAEQGSKANWLANCAPAACPAGYTDLGTHTEATAISYGYFDTTNGPQYQQSVNFTRSCGK